MGCPQRTSNCRQGLWAHAQSYEACLPNFQLSPGSIHRDILDVPLSKHGGLSQLVFRSLFPGEVVQVAHKLSETAGQAQLREGWVPNVS